MTTAIVWMRRDLRLHDHAALHAARERHAQVIPVYIHAPDEEAPWAPGGASDWWLHHSLAALGETLAERGSPLVLRRGPSLGALRALVRETGASAVYWGRLYDPALIARDKAVKEALREDGIQAESFNTALLREPWELKTGAGEPYRVFTPFWRKAAEGLIESGPLLPTPRQLAGPQKPVESLALAELKLLPTLGWDAAFPRYWQPGEAGARQRLKQFSAGPILHYKTQRDVPGVDGTSMLSPHLHFGEISPREALAVSRDAGREHGAGWLAASEAFVRELGWREFSHHLLFHYPQTPAEPLYAKFAGLPWRKRSDYAADLAAWQQGRTGIPLVDAGMRQLWATGWMHNRVRMIVASLLTKNLLIPWQEGAAWFWDTLVDASLPQNTLNWQWVAGCGADASPYYRIFNPLTQGAKFDADGAYVREWVPELAKLPDAYLHKPAEAPSDVRRKAGLALDSVYLKPIVDLAASRERALAAYQEIKGG